MKKMNFSNFLSLKVKTLGLLMSLTFIFALATSVQEVAAQARLTLTDAPTLLTQKQANLTAISELADLQEEVAILTVGSSAYNAAVQTAGIYDLILSNLVGGQTVQEAIDNAFISQFGQVPVAYTPPPTVVTNTNEFVSPAQSAGITDASGPNLNATNFSDILALYNEIIGKLSV